MFSRLWYLQFSVISLDGNEGSGMTAGCFVDKELLS